MTSFTDPANIHGMREEADAPAEVPSERRTLLWSTQDGKAREPENPSLASLLHSGRAVSGQVSGRH